MSKMVGSCKKFETACYNKASGILTAWANDVICRYDGSPYSKRDFILRSSHSWGSAYCNWEGKKTQLLEALRSVGATNIIGKVGWNYVTLAFDIKVKDLKKYREAEIADAARLKAEHEARLAAIDITPYIPTKKVLEKLEGYRQKGSMVNIKAIKSPEKMYSYYIAGLMMDWPELYKKAGRVYQNNFIANSLILEKIASIYRK